MECGRFEKVEGAGMIEGIIDLMCFGLGLGCLVTGMAIPIYGLIFIALIVFRRVKVSVTRVPKEHFKVVEKGDRDD